MRAEESRDGHREAWFRAGLGIRLHVGEGQEMRKGAGRDQVFGSPVSCGEELSSDSKTDGKPWVFKVRKAGLMCCREAYCCCGLEDAWEGVARVWPRAQCRELATQGGNS